MGVEKVLGLPYLKYKVAAGGLIAPTAPFY